MGRGLNKLAERHHPELQGARIVDLGWGRIRFDAHSRGRRWTTWETTIRRNEWFQQELLRILRHRHLSELREQPPGIFFAYSYAAGELFRFFKALGWTTILGQIDPAMHEENLVLTEVALHPELPTSWRRAPSRYWTEWLKEVDLADRIMVNSAWTQQAMVECGISRQKMHVVPLAHPSSPTPGRSQEAPKSFGSSRPLRVLFLGQINLRKGLSIVLEAMDRLALEPVEFWMVGPLDARLPGRFLTSPKIRWEGSVSRAQTTRFYREADLFLLPTLSDGFALTQLEAQSHQLPIIASRFCGSVVKDGVNGLLLDPLNAETLVLCLRRLMANPQRLRSMSEASRVDPEFSLDALQHNLAQVSRLALPAQAKPT
jgi:glycosyltransferase involved in cell wall biosynthesis